MREKERERERERERVVSIVSTVASFLIVKRPKKL